eukprot:1432383-Pleurochrysis_carterae.AAC.1
MVREGNSQKATPYVEPVTKESLTSIPLALTSASTKLGVQKPVVTPDCMAYLRGNVESIDPEEDEVRGGD